MRKGLQEDMATKKKTPGTGTGGDGGHDKGTGGGAAKTAQTIDGVAVEKGGKDPDALKKASADGSSRHAPLGGGASPAGSGTGRQGFFGKMNAGRSRTGPLGAGRGGDSGKPDGASKPKRRRSIFTWIADLVKGLLRLIKRLLGVIFLIAVIVGPVAGIWYFGLRDGGGESVLIDNGDARIEAVEQRQDSLAGTQAAFDDTLSDVSDKQGDLADKQGEIADKQGEIADNLSDLAGQQTQLAESLADIAVEQERITESLAGIAGDQRLLSGQSSQSDERYEQVLQRIEEGETNSIVQQRAIDRATKERASLTNKVEDVGAATQRDLKAQIARLAERLRRAEVEVAELRAAQSEFGAGGIGAIGRGVNANLALYQAGLNAASSMAGANLAGGDLGQWLDVLDELALAGLDLGDVAFIREAVKSPPPSRAQLLRAAGGFVERLDGDVLQSDGWWSGITGSFGELVKLRKVEPDAQTPVNAPGDEFTNAVVSENLAAAYETSGRIAGADDDSAIADWRRAAERRLGIDLAISKLITRMTTGLARELGTIAPAGSQ